MYDVRLLLPGRVTRGEGRCHVRPGRGAGRGQSPDRPRGVGSARTIDMRGLKTAWHSWIYGIGF